LQKNPEMRIILFLTGLLITTTFGFAQETEEVQHKEIIKSIYFGGGSWYIDQQQMEELKEFVKSLENLSIYTITVISHTDNIGGIEYNNWLSTQRSKAVVRELLLNEVGLEQIITDDRGQHTPLYDNMLPQGRMMNRRVDIKFTPLIL
jgi:OOP family OmpA-OmpF porin